MADTIPLPDPDARDDKGRRRRLRKLTVGAEDLGDVLSVSRRTIYTLHGAGKIPAPIKIGRRTLWYLPEIRRWIEAGMPERAAWEAIKEQRTKKR